MFKFTVIILLFLILFTQCMGCVAVPGVVTAVAIPAEGYSTYKAITTTKAAVDLTLAASDKKTTNDIVLSNFIIIFWSELSLILVNCIIF